MSNKKKSREERATTARRSTELMQQQRAKEKRRNALVQAGLLVTTVVVVIGLVLVFLYVRDQRSQPATAPSDVTSEGGYVVGQADAPVTLTVVEDLQCPACQAFEAASGEKLAELAESGDVAVEYRVVAFLDRASSDEYSSRAANASACVWDEGDPEAWRSFHDTLYAQQPAEGGPGLTDEQLVSLAADAGADGDAVGSCISDGEYRSWVSQHTEAVSDSGIGATPTVLVDGEDTDARTPEQLQAAVDEALA